MDRAVARIFLAVVFFGVTSEAAELKWRKYSNGRFGYVLSYPSALIAGPESQNGSGRELHTADGEFSLAVSAHFFAPDIGDTFESRWQEELKSLAGTITYQKKAKTWYVVSGVTKTGTEYYHKLHRDGENWVAFQITYPHAKNEKYDNWVAEIAQRFVAFRAGDYDRVE